MDLEKKLAKFYGTPGALIYAQGFSTISSVIPAFLKRGDLLIWYFLFLFLFYQ